MIDTSANFFAVFWFATKTTDSRLEHMGVTRQELNSLADSFGRPGDEYYERGAALVEAYAAGKKAALKARAE